VWLRRESNSDTAGNISPTGSKDQRQKRSNGTKYCRVDRWTRCLRDGVYLSRLLLRELHDELIFALRGTMSPRPMNKGPFDSGSWHRLPFSFAGVTLLSNPAALAIFEAKEPVKRRRLEKCSFFLEGSRRTDLRSAAPQQIGYRWLVGL
jgi:hypothetical protein